MAEREVRRRKKKKDGTKKEVYFEDTAFRKLAGESEAEEEEHISCPSHHEAAGTLAKVVFVVLLVAILAAVGAIFLSLSGSSHRSLEIVEDQVHQPEEPHSGEDTILSAEELIPESSEESLEEPSATLGPTEPELPANSIKESEPEVQLFEDSEEEEIPTPVHLQPDPLEYPTPSPPPYEKIDITNDEDLLIKEKLDDLDDLAEKNPEKATASELLSRYPSSPRVLYAKARALSKVAEKRKSNAILEEAISVYQELTSLPKVPKALLLLAAQKCVEHLRFLGKISKAIIFQTTLINKFPKEISLKNQLAVSYLMIGQGKQAKKILEEVLHQKPEDGFAKVHLGFILKTEDNDYPRAIRYLREGIDTKEPGVVDGRFYFHLGDALARTQQKDKAMEVYKEGVAAGVFSSVYQRSLYNVDGLRAQPWWNPWETPYSDHFKVLESNWQIIKTEALSLLNAQQSGFQPESEGLRETGDWKQMELFARGMKITKNCQKAPKTCSLIEPMKDAARCRRGQVKFSLMSPGTHVWAHTGPTNCRLRAHLGLVIPSQGELAIRVANETRKWKEGKILLFDDSFEHEVWHNGSSFRLVLIIDFWHPDLTDQQKRSLSPI